MKKGDVFVTQDNEYGLAISNKKVITFRNRIEPILGDMPINAQCIPINTTPPSIKMAIKTALLVIY